MTQPFVHDLCGPLQLTPLYQATVNGVYETLNGDEPVTYSDVNQRFTAFSSDANLIGTTKNLKVYVQLLQYPIASYPTVTTSEQIGQIRFLDPCTSSGSATV